jgi:hypothetical protein
MPTAIAISFSLVQMNRKKLLQNRNKKIVLSFFIKKKGNRDRKKTKKKSWRFNFHLKKSTKPVGKVPWHVFFLANFYFGKNREKEKENSVVGIMFLPKRSFPKVPFSMG